MRNTRLALASLAAGALVMGFAPSALASTPGGCNAEDSGAQGLTCTNVGSNLYPGIAANFRLPSLSTSARLGLLTPTCDNVSGLLIQARLAVQTDHKVLVTDRQAALKAHQNLVAAQKADAAALAARDAAVATANTQYNADVAAAPADNPATPAIDEHAVALAAALTKRNAAISTANNAYLAGGTAAALTAAQTAAKAADARCAADQKAEAADAALIASLQVDLTKCQTPPVAVPPGFKDCAEANAAGFHDIPVSDSHYRTYLDADHDGIACETPKPVVTPPAPVVIQAPDNPVVVSPSPAPVIVNNPQVGIVPQGAAPTGAVNAGDRFTG